MAYGVSSRHFHNKTENRRQKDRQHDPYRAFKNPDLYPPLNLTLRLLARAISLKHG